MVAWQLAGHDPVGRLIGSTSNPNRWIISSNRSSGNSRWPSACLTEISHGVTELTRIWFSGAASATCIRRSSRVVSEIAQIKTGVSSRKFSGLFLERPQETLRQRVFEMRTNLDLTSI